MALTKKQIAEIEKAQVLVAKAHELLTKNLEHYSYDVVLAQTLSRSTNLHRGMNDLVECIKEHYS